MLIKGKYQLREAQTQADLRAAQSLRAACFGQSILETQDPIDALCRHVLVEDRQSGVLVCCYRLLSLRAADLGQSYAAHFYDLGRLGDYPGLMMEVGRFCIEPCRRDPDILRIAWAGLTQQVDQLGVEFLFGCSSFEGIDPAPYAEAFHLLQTTHLAPMCWRPKEKAAEVVHFDGGLSSAPIGKGALLGMPSLLRTYLLMGGWVSDHAVVDRQLNTLHVFTGVEIGAIPEARKRLLRGLI